MKCTWGYGCMAKLICEVAKICCYCCAVSPGGIPWNWNGDCWIGVMKENPWY